MRKTTVAAIQMGCGSDVKENIEKASELIREAAAQGAQVILPPELFERPYFCQERRYEYYGYARTLEEDDAVIHMKKLAKELETVIPGSFYEAGDQWKCARHLQENTYSGRPLLSGKILFYAR